MTFLSFERSFPLFWARLTSFLKAVVLLTDLTGQGDDRDASSIHGASRLCPFGCPEELWRFGRWEAPPQREVRGGAGFGEREAESHPKRSFPMRTESFPPGF
jgi:hypothetical protein